MVFRRKKPPPIPMGLKRDIVVFLESHGYACYVGDGFLRIVLVDKVPLEGWQRITPGMVSDEEVAG